MSLGAEGLMAVSCDVNKSGSGVSNSHSPNCFDILYQNVRGIMTKQCDLRDYSFR